MRNIKQYEKSYLEQYDFERFQVRFRRRKVLELLQNYCHRQILEIGCGAEPLFEFVNDFDEFTVVEPSELFYQNALEKATLRKNIRCIHGLFEQSLSIINNQVFDYIIVSCLLHELEKPITFLKEVKKVCHSDTVVHINVPNANSFHRLLAVESGMISSIYDSSQRNMNLQQNRVYDIESLVHDISLSAQIEILEKGSYFIKPLSHNQMMKCLQYGVFTEKVLDGLYNLSHFMPDFGSEIYINFKFLAD